MKSFIKFLLIVIIAVIAVKLLPLTFALGCILALALLGMAAFGLSAMAILLAVAITLAAILSPVWIPLLLIVGLIALIKRSGKSSVAN